MINELKNLKKKYSLAEKYFKKKNLTYFCVTITTNTSKDTNNIYLPPLREIDNILIFGVVVYSSAQLKKICQVFNKSVDAIFVDTEKKIPFLIGSKHIKKFNTKKIHSVFKKERLSNEFVELGNLTSTVKSNTKNLLVHEFKPNDITVEHVWLLLRKHFGILGKKKMAIIGSGNIGFKLGLKLVESGVTVVLNRRNLDKCIFFSNAINLIKPESTLADAVFSTDKIKACFSANAIIGCSNSLNIINEDMLKCMKPNGIVIDVGKGNLTKQAINYANKRKIKVIRCDITKTINNYVNFYYKFFKENGHAGFQRIEKSFNIVSGGYIGKKGDVVVDNFKKPGQILGISDGSGKFVKKILKSEKTKIKILKKKFNLDF